MTRGMPYLVLAACSSPPSPAPPRLAPLDATTEQSPPIAEASTGPIEVTWEPTRLGNRLRLDYIVRNRGDQPVILCDRMRNTKGPTERAVVQPSGTDRLVAFTLAFVRPFRVIVENQPRPIAHMLAPGESLAGVSFVELPIRPFHPVYDPVYTIPSAEYAVLEVGYVEASWPLDTEKLRGETYEVPDWAALHHQKLVRGEVHRLP
jgi:hypothetical protein